MAALLIARSAAGRVIGRCDERCYLSQHNQCRCICGGRNHGVGLQAAAANSRHIATIDYSGLDEPAPPGSCTLERHPELQRLATPQLFS